MTARWLAPARLCFLWLLVIGVLANVIAANAAPPGEDPPAAAPASASSSASAAPQNMNLTAADTGFLGQYAKGPSWFPKVWQPYIQQPIAEPVMENSPRIRDLIHDGKLELSLTDALALTLENNLDIAVERYVMSFAQTDILRTKSGQADRGFTGALQPGELNSGAIGAGVTSSGSSGGTGNAGGISGGGGPVSIGATGAFDPTLSFGYSWDRATSPLNTLVVSGIPNSTSYAESFSGSYSQLFENGLSYSVALSSLRQSTTQENTLYNPDVASRLATSFNQPLLNGMGRLPNERFMLVARNNQRTAQEVFRLQVITSVVQLEDAYWNYAAFEQNVRVAEQSLAAAKELLDETKKQAEVGTLAHLDVVTAESQVAASDRDLIVAKTNRDEQQTNLKQLLSKKNDPVLDAATIVITDQLPEPRDADLPPQEDALTTATANRPELREAQNNLQNQNVAIKFTQNNQLPTLSVFGLFAGSGLQGNNTLLTAGATASLDQSFTAAYPEYAYGLTLSATLRNRSAQADSMRSQMERNQLEISQQDTRNQIDLQVRQARIGLIQGKSQVEAAHEAVRLAQETLDAEQKKLQAGVSTSYNVILRERDLVSAQYAEVQAVGSYANALVEMDRAMGTTLDRNGIQFGDALSGTVSNRPTPPFSVRGFNPGQGAAQGTPGAGQ